MTKKLLFVTALLLALALVAAAADVNGKWVFEQAGRMGGGTVTVTLTLKAEDGKLTGNVARPGREGAMMETPIKDGTISGDNVSFKTEMTFGDRTMTTEYSGAVSGNEMKLKITRQGRDGNPMTTEVTAKKAS
jgi:opacity protein-like surface antigen